MPSDPRVHIAFRAAPKARDSLDEIAHEHRVDRSTVIRAVLKVGMAHKAEVVAILKGRL